MNVSCLFFFVIFKNICDVKTIQLIKLIKWEIVLVVFGIHDGVGFKSHIIQKAPNFLNFDSKT